MKLSRLVPVVVLVCGVSGVASPTDAGAAPPAAPQQAGGKPTEEKKPAAPKPQVFNNPKEAGLDYSLQGEYAGQVNYERGQANVGFQVIALGNGEFQGVFYYGGLPGAGWDKKTKHESTGKLVADEIVFEHLLGSGRVRGEQFSPARTRRQAARAGGESRT